jgi:hypothetical protein
MTILLLLVFVVSWWVLAIGIFAILVISWFRFEPTIRKMQQGWVFWYTDLHDRRQYIILKKAKKTTK